MKQKIFLCALICLPLFWSCSSSKFSYKKKNSTIEVAVVERRDVLQINMLAPQELVAGNKQRGMLTPFLGMGMNFATQLVKQAIDNEQKKYFAQNESGATDLFFYECVSQRGPVDPTGMQFGGLSIIRTFETKKGVVDTAYIIELEVDTSDVQGVLNNEFFRLKVKKADIRYAEAKVPGSRWYFPWTYYQHKKKDDKLNMDIEISLTTSFVNSAGELNKNVEVGKFYLFMRDIPLQPKKSDYQEYRKNMVGQTLIGKCFLVPRSVGYFMEDYGSIKECFSRGYYNVNVIVTESGSDKFVNRALFNNSSILIDAASGKLKGAHRKKAVSK